MNDVTAALRYARALYDVASDADALPAVLDDMRSIDRILSEVPEIRKYCLDTGHSSANHLEFVELAFCSYVHELTARTLRIAAQNGRLTLVPFLPSAYNRVCAEKADIEQVVLETAQPADDALLKSALERMRRRLSKDVDMENRTNPDLIGGFRILWRDRVLDDSALARLHALGRQMGTTG